MAESWTNEEDRANPNYRRIYDEAGISVARVYEHKDALLIVHSPELQEFCRRIAVGEVFNFHDEARRLLDRTGGKL